jgi:Uma2 family endonuclease
MALMATAGTAREWTVADLETMPGDGNRYELVEGMLLVTPPPYIPHQVTAFELAKLLQPVLPVDLLLIPGPAQVTSGDRTSLEPDLSVARRSDIARGKLTGAPLLVVEVLSPSTRSKDQVLKRSVYAEIGIPSYWIVDPVQPSVLVLELMQGTYVERDHAVADDELTVSRPAPLTFRPRDLVVEI